MLVRVSVRVSVRVRVRVTGLGLFGGVVQENQDRIPAL
jgi:hypothetical protein